MTKIMLVEDDNNLREIYEARLAAEGFEIVSAEDGEAALAIAAKERPNLVITDVMMPKISGFEMLDILRNTDTLHDVKVIMLTALSQAEDNARAGKLGADRYLVKSQVTLEDIVKAAHELLDGNPADASSAADAAVPKATDTAIPAAAAAVVAADTPADAPTDTATDDSKPADDEAASATPAPEAEAPVISVAEPPASENEAPKENDPAAEEPKPAEDNTPKEEAAPTTEDKPADTPEAQEAKTEEPAAESTTEEKPEESADSKPEPDQAAAEAELANAQTTSEEESALQSQINQFLTTTGDKPAEFKPAEENSETTSSEGATDVNLESNLGGQNLFSAPPADESEEEYAKDDATPDQGNMTLHETGDTPAVVEPAPAEPAPQPEATPQPEAIPQPEPTPTPAPTPPMELPTPVVPQPSAPEPTPGGPAMPEQTVGDQVVSSAIDSMMAQSPTGTSEPVLPPSEAWKQKDQPDAPAQQTVPVMGAPEGQPEPDPNDMPAGTQRPIAPDEHPTPEPGAPSAAAQTTRTPKKVITPLEHGAKPDIQQLLSMEEAKNGALMAAAQTAPGVSPQPEPAPAPPPQQPPTANNGLDPNAVAL